jgi:nucleoside-diphosphate-sugar epimerase
LQAPPAFADIVRAIDDLERTVLQSRGIEGIALRYGYLYGPGTAYAADGTLAEDVRRRRIPVIGNGGGIFSYVHVEDAADATVLALNQGEAGIYNIVDDEPTPLREWLPIYAELLGAPQPMRVPKMVGQLVGSGSIGRPNSEGHPIARPKNCLAGVQAIRVGAKALPLT